MAKLSELERELYPVLEALTTRRGRLMYLKYWIGNYIIAQGYKLSHIPRREMHAACVKLLQRWRAKR